MYILQYKFNKKYLFFIKYIIAIKHLLLHLLIGQNNATVGISQNHVIILDFFGQNMIPFGFDIQINNVQH